MQGVQGSSWRYRVLQDTGTTSSHEQPRAFMSQK